MNLQARV